MEMRRAWLLPSTAKKQHKHKGIPVEKRRNDRAANNNSSHLPASRKNAKVSVWCKSSNAKHEPGPAKKEITENLQLVQYSTTKEK